MNLFVLDEDFDLCAQQHNDKHVVKIILEASQVACLAHTMTGGSPPYKGLGFRNHKIAKWVRESMSNYLWAVEMGLALCREYTFRYGKIHKTQAVLEWLKNHSPNIPNGPRTPFVQAMPDDVKNDDAVKAYRDYYLKYKRHLAFWKKRGQPEWWT